MADDNPSTTDTTPQGSSPTHGAGLPRRIQRPVYEPTLLPPRKRRRASPWVVIPTLLIVLAAILYVVLVLPRHRRFVATAGEIVFATDTGTPGHPHLWIASADGQGAHRLTDSHADETEPSWSPDGSQIGYLSSRPGEDAQVFVVDADGSNVAQVTHNAGAKSRPRFAPSDNTLMGFLSGGALSTVDVPTGQTVRLLPVISEGSQAQSADAALTGSPTTTITSYQWTPVKDRAQQGLEAIAETGGIQALLLLPTLTDKPVEAHPDHTPLAAADTVTAGWSPDGGLIAVAMMGVQGLPPGQQLSALGLLDGQGNPSGQKPLAVFKSAGLGPQHPVFAPDGIQVMCEVWQGADLAHQHSVGLMAAPTDGSTPPHAVFKGPATDVRFTPDGRTTYFLCARPDGGRDLCRIGADGTGYKRISKTGSDTSSVEVSPQMNTHP